MLQGILQSTATVAVGVAVTVYVDLIRPVGGSFLVLDTGYHADVLYVTFLVASR
jgi:hypothetical protein